MQYKEWARQHQPKLGGRVFIDLLTDSQNDPAALGRVMDKVFYWYLEECRQLWDGAMLGRRLAEGLTIPKDGQLPPELEAWGRHTLDWMMKALSAVDDLSCDEGITIAAARELFKERRKKAA